MRYFALACDYDGTIATAGKVSKNTIAAIERLGESGRKAILVTGREMSDLLQVFPELKIFDRIVAENGALLYRPQTAEVKLLAAEAPAQFIEALRKKGIPLYAGQSIVATREPHDAAALEVIRGMGLDLQLIYNKGSVMMLPSGVNKATGLMAALGELGLSAHNTVGVGDAENDHALLAACECGVAVANAIPVLRERADLTMQSSAGEGVEELIEKLLRDDLREAGPRLGRHHILLGKTRDDREFSLKPYGENVVIAGPSASGKSTAVMAILERLIEKAYQVCLVDPEGDYEDAGGTVSLGSPTRAPERSEIFHVLNDPKSSVRVNLVGLPLAERPPFFAALLPKLQELRARTGRPHWLIVDEAHHVLPASWNPAPATIPQELTGTILTTVHVDQVAPAAVKPADTIIAVGPAPRETFDQFHKIAGVAAPPRMPSETRMGEVVVWSPKEKRGPIAVRMQPPSGEMRRHKRKYAEGTLPEDLSFYFKGPQGKLNLRAQNLVTFIQLAEGVDDETWLFHLHEGAYSRWMREVIKDEDLAREASRIEGNSQLSPRESRAKIIEAISHRYTAPE